MDYSLSTFTAPDNTRLDQYDGETNADWQRPFTTVFPNLNRIDNNRVHRTRENPNVGTPSNNAGDHFLSNYTIPNASYVVEAEFWNGGVFEEYPDPMGIIVIPPPPDTYHPNGTVTRTSEAYLRSNSLASIGGRATTGNYNGYRITYDQLNALWSLQKIVNNSATITLTYFDIIPVGSTRLVQLVLRGYWIEMWIDGVQRKFFRDEGVGSFSTTGLATLRFTSGPDNALVNEFSTKGIHLSSFRVHDEFPPMPIQEEIILYGSGNSNGEVSLNWTD